jgi:hypothetical protein
MSALSSVRAPPSSLVRSVSLTSVFGSEYAMSPRKIAATPYFSPIFLSASASSWLPPTAASSGSRFPNSMKRVPGCAAWICS